MINGGFLIRQVLSVSGCFSNNKSEGWTTDTLREREELLRSKTMMSKINWVCCASACLDIRIEIEMVKYLEYMNHRKKNVFLLLEFSCGFCSQINCIHRTYVPQVCKNIYTYIKVCYLKMDKRGKSVRLTWCFIANNSQSASWVFNLTNSTITEISAISCSVEHIFNQQISWYSCVKVSTHFLMCRDFNVFQQKILFSISTC